MTDNPKNIPFVEDKYKDKAVRFYDKSDHYELILADQFTYPGSYDPTEVPNNTIIDVVQDMRAADKTKELHILVSSYGGAVSALAMLLQQVSEFEYRVGVNLGTACSCGFMVLMYCHELYCSPFAEFMFHDMTTVSYSKVKEMRSYAAFGEDWWQTIIDQSFIDKCLTADEIKAGETTEVWLTGRDMINRRVANPYTHYTVRRIPRTPVADIYRIGGRVFSYDPAKACYVELVAARPSKKNNNNTFAWVDLVMLNSGMEAQPIGVVETEVGK